MVAKKRKQREPFGRIRKLPSGRYQAAYTGPDVRLHKAPATFDTLMDARGWIAGERRRIDADTWTAPEHRQASRPATLEPTRPHGLPTVHSGRGLGSFMSGCWIRRSCPLWVGCRW